MFGQMRWPACLVMPFQKWAVSSDKDAKAPARAICRGASLHALRVHRDRRTQASPQRENTWVLRHHV